MSPKLTITAGLIALLSGCRDDVRIKLVGTPKIPGLEDFKIESAANLITRDTYSLEWSTLPNAKSYDVMISQNPDCTGEVAHKKALAEQKLVLDFLSDGQYYLCVWGQMVSDAYPAANNGVSLLIDKTPPLVKLPNDTLTYNASFNPLLEVKDLTETTVSWRQLQGSGTIIFANPTSLQAGLTASVDGTYKIAALLTDKAGNQTEQAYTFVWDTAAPAVELGDPIFTAVARTLPVSVDSSAVRYAWSFAQGPANGSLLFSDAASKAPTLSANLEGSYQVTLTAYDAAGNAGSDQVSFTWDQTAPIFSSAVLAGPAVDGFINSTERASSTSLLGGITATDYLDVQYRLTTALSTCNSSLSYNGIIPSANSSAMTAEGTYKICLELKDAAGLTTYAASPSFVLDTTPPTITSIALANDAADAYINASEHAQANDMVANLIASDSYLVEYSLVSNATSCSGPLTYSTAVPKSNDTRFAAIGAYKVCVRVTDQALNTPALSASAAITFDNQPPIFTAIALANEGSDGLILVAEVASTLPAFTLSATDYTTASYTPALSDNPTLVCDANRTYSASALPLVNSITSDGSYAVCTRLSDAAGNIVYGKSAQLVRDVDPPQFVSLAAANEASDNRINNAEKNSVLAGWSLSANGYSAAAYTLPLDDTGSAVVCDVSQTYGQTSIPLITAMTSDLPWVICVRLSDTLGNITYGKSQVITRDIVAPSFTSLNGANEASNLYINSSEAASMAALLALSASAYDNVAYTVALDDTPAVSCDNTQTYDQSSIPRIDSLGTDESYAVCARLSDNAGNITYGKSQVIIKDTLAPTFTSLVRAAEGSDGYINDSEKAQTTALWTLSASGHSAAAYTLALDDTGGTQTCNGSDTYDQGTTIPGASGLASDGAWTVCVQLTDAAGNTTYGKGEQIVRDILAPTITSLNGANEASDLFINSTEEASTAALLTLSASAYDAAAYTVGLDDTPAITCNNTQTYDQGSIPLISSLGADESYAVCLRLSDNAGNTTYGKSQVIVKDTTAPTFTSLAATAEASNGFINDSEKAQTNDLWTLTASGHTASAYTVALSDTSGLQICNSSDTYDQGTNIPGAADLGSDGAWTLCVRLTDAAGNITYGKGGQVIRDIGLPSFSSLALANAASDSYINDSEKLLVNAMWTLTASGQSATDYTIALSDTGGTQICDGSDTYDQASIPTPSSLGSDGAYALCVRLSDAAGNIVYGKSAQVTRDIAFPAFTSLNLANEAVGGYISSGEENSALALYTLTASNYDTDDFTAALSDNPVSVTCDSGQTYGGGSVPLINSISTDGAYAVCVRLADAAGNNTYGKSQQVTRDLIAPSFTSLAVANEAADGYVAFGERNSTNPGWALTASGHTAANYTVPLDDTAAAVSCDVGKTYSAGSIPLINAMTTDGPWAVCVQLTDAAGNISYGKSQQIIRDIVAPGTPSAFTATAGNAYIDLKWTASTGTPTGYVLVRGPAGSAPTFVPSDGTTYNLGAQGSDQIIAIGAATLKMDSPLNIDTSYSYKVYAYDTAISYSAAASASATPLTPCASNYVFVPGDPDYGTKDFCVMKYEAKDVGGFATAQASSTPWVSTTQQNSIAKCASNGFAYHLINNNEWMTIGSHVAAINDNWTGGTVGSGSLVAGHNDNNPASACAASSNDGQFYVETDCTNVSTGDTAEQRRTLTLSNSTVIWDFSGNVWDWVNYLNVGDKPGATFAYYEYSALTGTTTTPLMDLVPTNAVKAFWTNTWNSGQWIGQYYPGTNGSAGALIRGGPFSDGSGAGVFAALLNNAPSASNSHIGFRCAQNLPDLDAPTLALAASSSQITSTWTTVGGATGYILVRGAAGSLPSFQPVNGTTYSAGSQGADQIVYAGTALTFADTGLDNNREYNYALYSYTAGPVYSLPARSKETPLACPTGFVLVPGDTDYGTDDFCVMKYEAKNIGGVAASKPENAPWVSISQENSLTACNAMGPGYQLISNPEWMTLGSNIAALGGNWSSGTVGTGNLFRGHTDTNPSAPCQASTDDTKAYVEYNCEPKSQGQGEDSESTQKRTFTLSNSQVIWDLSGNIYEWVTYFNSNDKPGATAAWYEYSSLTGTTTTPLNYLIPTNAVKSFWSNSWDSTQSTGRFYPGTNASGGAMRRGARWASAGDSGIFTAYMSSNTSDINDHSGLRCVLRGLTPETPKAFAAVASKDSVSLSWDKGGSTTTGYLLVRGQAGKLPLFQPARGTPYTAGAQGSDTVIYVGNGKSKVDTGLATGSNFHYRLYGYDSSHNYSSAALQSAYVTPCAENWVFVPGDSDYGTKDFCVMKYEAKNDGSANAISQAASTPWVSISQNDSITKCDAIGQGYHLINNDEWMSIGSNLAAQAGNWTGASVGTGLLVSGHTDNSPASTCAASSDDSLFYVESTCTAVSSGDATDQRRTLSLSTTEVIWDFPGNALEIVNYFNLNDKPGATNAYHEYTALSGTPTMSLARLIPTQAIKSYWVDTWNSTQLIGQFYNTTNGNGGTLIRGGAYSHDVYGGVFQGHMATAPTSTTADIGFRCTQSLGDKDAAALALLPSTSAISATWTSTGATGYLLVRGPGGSQPSFTPVDGTGYSMGAQGSDTILSAGAALSYNNTSLSTGGRYHYALYSYDASNNYSLLARDHETPLACPTGYILIPGDKDYGTEDFCVMKYEAKNNGSNVAISQAANASWASITQQDAKTECTAVGPGYDLISNDEWMTIGSNVAAINSNWTGGTVGSGFLFAGHNDSDPNVVCGASSDDALFFVETDCTPVSSGDDPEQRRTHSLSNTAVIWDLSGNVNELVNYFNSEDKPGATASWHEYPALSGTATTALRDLVPTNAVKAFWSDAWNTGNHIGRLYPGTNGSGGALLRGGRHDNSTNAGVFAARLDDTPTDSGSRIGFRCAFHGNSSGPVFFSLTKANQGSDGYINDSEKSATDPLWTLSATDYSAVAYTPILSDTGGAQVCDVSDVYSAGTTLPTATDIPSDGEWTVCAQLTGAGGTIIYGKAEQIVREIVAPSFTSLAVANAASDSYINDSEKLLVNDMWTLTASGQTATAYTAALAAATGGLVCDGSDTYDQGGIADPSSLSSDGDYVLCVRLSDAAGNITYGKSAQITRDILPPTITSLNGANAASDLIIKSGEESSTDPLYALVASGQSSDDFTPALDDDPAITCNSGQTYDQATIPLINSIGSDGSYAVCVKLTDAAGNIAYGKSQQVLRDITAPSFTSLSGANEAADGYIADGEKGSTAAGWTLSASGHSAANYTSVLDDTSAAVTCDVGKTYGGGSIPLINTMSTDGPWAVCVQLTDAAGNIAYGKSQQITRDTAPPSVPGSLTATPGNRFIDLKWTASTGTPAGYVIVRGPVGSAPTFVPSDGQTYSAGANGADTIIYVGLATLKLDDQLLIGRTYSYKVFAFDAALGYSAAASASATPLTPCATGYVFVPGDPDYGTTDFCVMKYEAKDVGGYPASAATGTPQVSTSLGETLTKCASNGLAYHTIRNGEWMTLAADIYQSGSNWTGASVGTGSLFLGHSDSDPLSACAASSDDNEFFVEGSCTPSTSSDSALYQRTFTLPNGEVIWDIAGNVWDNVDFYNEHDKPTPMNSNWHEFTALTESATVPMHLLVPTRAIKTNWVDTWNSTQGIGQFFVRSQHNGGVYARGGAWVDGARSGLYAINSNHSMNVGAVEFGFRCAQNLPDLDPISMTLATGDNQIAASWTAVGGAAGYVLVRGAAASLPAYQPVTGSIPSVGTEGSDSIVYVGTGLSYTDTAVSNHNEYHYALYSYDASSVYSGPARSKEIPLKCPAGFVLVPGNATYGVNDFCLMKYEAKQLGSMPASIPEQAPWGGISYRIAMGHCHSMGPNFRLHSNPEWMSTAINAASLGTNWSSGAVGTGNLYSGHNDNNPPAPCQASTDPSKAYVEHNCQTKLAGEGENSESTQRRTFYLSNGEIVWDLAGNMGERVNHLNGYDKPGAAGGIFEFKDIVGTSTTPMSMLIPSNALYPFWNDNWTSTQGIGRYVPDTNGGGKVFQRGGDWFDGSEAGLFGLKIHHSDSNSGSNYGFRCSMNLFSPGTPRSFTADALGTTKVALAWAPDSSATTGFLLLRGQLGKFPQFQPERGTTYSAGAQGSDTIVYVGNNRNFIDTGLASSGSYHYYLYAYGAGASYSTPQRQALRLSPCEENWVYVPGDPDYGTNDFCVMKYEAKSDGATIPAALSQAASTPWVSISQNDSITKCNAIGPGYHLISNNEWMTIGANVAAVNGNWTGGTVGSGSLFAGHNDNSPTSPCAASTDDSLYYVETNCTGVNSGDTAEQRRTLTLSNSAVIWDLAGNVWEWVNYMNQGDKPGATNAWYEYTGVTGTATTALKDLVPTNAVKAFWSDAWNSGNWIGQYYPGTNGSGGALFRGGNWYHGSVVGVFAIYMVEPPSNSITDGGLRCVQSLPDLDSTTLTLTPGSTAINTTWTSNGAASYLLVRGPANSEPTFAPDDGTSYGTGSQGSDTILYAGSSLSYLDTTLINNTKYFYSLYAEDGSNNYTLLARGMEKPLSCPAGFVHIPGDKDYGTEDFCVMKYEAKNNGSNVAISQAADTPWVSISQETSKTECTAMGPGYDLINNNEWMTIGANVAALGGNWTNGTVGSDYLFAGHNDNSPASACAASTDDSLFYVETTCTPVSSGGSAEQRRTLTLSNSTVIWDFSGNVWEWVNYFNIGDKPGATAAWYEYTAVTGTKSTALKELVPTNAVKAFWSDAWDSGKWIGQYEAGTNGSGGALLRGGAWNYGGWVGVFGAGLSNPPTHAYTDLGFRCTSAPSP